MHFVLLVIILAVGTFAVKYIIFLPLNFLNLISLPFWLLLLGFLAIFSWLVGE